MYNAEEQMGAFSGVAALLGYFHLEETALPRDVSTLEEAVDFLNEETELILIPIDLEGDWYRTAAGPLLVRDGAGMDLAVLPDWRGRFYFRDGGTGRRIYLTGKNCRQFTEGYSVCRDFRKDSLGPAALVGRMFREIGRYEGGLLLLWGLLAGGLWGLLAERVRGALSVVILTAEREAFWGTAAVILVLFLLEALLVYSGRQTIRRAAQKGALAMLVGLGGRLYAAEGMQEAAGVAAAMAALRNNGERVMTWLLTTLWEMIALALILPGLRERSPAAFAAAAAIALTLYAAAAALFLQSAGRRRDGQREQDRREWLLRLAADRRQGIRRPYPKPRGRGLRDRLPGAAWPAAMLLTLPMIYFAIAGGYSIARLAQMLLLYLPGVVLPLGALMDAPGVGRAMAEIRLLLPLAKRRPVGSMALPPVGSVFELKDVSFSYPDRTEPVLRGVNLRLYPGEVVGIAGATGSGKTTLERLMTGLLKPASGEIYYGGIALSRYNGSALRRRVAWERGSDVLLCGQVPQERDGRICVVFSARPETLAGCDQILRLQNGVLVKEEMG